MAEQKKGGKSGGGARKIGSKRIKPAQKRYVASSRKLTNKLKKLRRVARQNPNDKQAARRLEALGG